MTRLAASAALSPLALTADAASREPRAPTASDVQIFIGDADALATRCSTFVDNYRQDAPHRPALVVYPGARHSFDADRPDRVYFGHRLAHDAKATTDAFMRTRKFLDEHLH